MFGGGSIQLARVFGIRIGVDASWFLILFLLIWSMSDYYGDIFPGDDGKSFVLAIVSALLFFVSVLLHELGHAVVARRNGIGIVGIDLWMFGGMAKMERDTDSPSLEFRVAVAGPLVTLVIAVLCFGAGALLAGAGQSFEAGSFDLDGDVGSVPLGQETLAVLGYLTFINVLLLGFNLLPAFPLDGGRIARAIAWWRTGDRTRATHFAARLGRGLSLVMIGGGIFLAVQGLVVTGIWLAAIGWIIGQAARTAELQTVIASRIEGVRVADVMDAEPVAVRAEAALDRAYDDYFLRYGYPWFPVVDGAGRLVGLVTRESVAAVPHESRAARDVSSVMAGDPGSGMQVGTEEPLEALLGRDGLARLGAIMAVDRDGRLRGIVTADQVRNALHSPAPVPP